MPDTFLAPIRLWILVVVPVLVAAYGWQQRRRQLRAVRFSAVPRLGGLAVRRPGWRRHVVAAGLVLALVPLIVAFARPAAIVPVPKERATVVLAVDVSLSMNATDVSPTRLAAAQQAAETFLNEVPPKMNVGVVSFAQGANLLVPPTTDRTPAIRSIQTLQLAPFTAIGEAIYVSIDALQKAPRDPGDPEALPPSAVILLSDGSSTAGRDQNLAAEQAGELGIPVHTVAFGTVGSTLEVDGVITDVSVEREALEEIAELSGGRAYQADSVDSLEEVYSDIGSDVGYEDEETEISARWAGMGLMLLLLTSIGSVTWFGRLP
ncbi:MAG: VWA domain-containing protein [Micrococcales bacterium]|nr:MAG: VWA domain-containing protein [Micrococcales bacterium]